MRYCLISIFIICLLCGCGGGDDYSCKHDYGEWSEAKLDSYWNHFYQDKACKYCGEIYRKKIRKHTR